ncbi:MAG: hypothetical protein HYX78_05285, partial [Armatimonadetes bacterium]|nr:hypothetical protein [Armatimonadota bacterium]
RAVCGRTARTVRREGRPGNRPSLPLSSLQSTSPELRLRYLGGDEKPLAPPAGYIGHAFDVTTDTGDIPPGAMLDLSYDGEDTSAIGGTQYLAVYRYDTTASTWVKVGGTVKPEEATIETPITELGYYTISADLPADTTAPQVFIDNPAYGSTINLDTTVRATVNDDLGAWRVSFYMNGHLLHEDADSLDFWTANIPIIDYCTGDWTLSAVAEDLAGNTGTAEIPIHINSATPPPTVSITSPADGADLTGSATVTGTCWDNVSVASVALYTDNTLIGYGELDGSGGWSCQIDTTYLANGTRTLKAVVEDYPGNSASASISVNVDNGSVSLGSAKSSGGSSTARVNGITVTAGTPEMGGAFYIESDDRSAGIRVISSLPIQEGDRVNVAGVIQTVNGEPQMTASDVAIVSSGNTLPLTLGSSQQAFRVGLANTGLLVKLWGRIKAAPEGTGYFYLDDGSGLSDGSQYTGIRVYGQPPENPVGRYVTVTGISSVEMVGSVPIPVIRTRRSADVSEVPEP